MPHHDLPAGYVKLYRSVLQHPVFANGDLLRLWLWCLLRAAFKPTTIAMRTGRGRTEVLLKRGEMLFGRYTCAGELGIAPSTAQRQLTKLERMGCIKRYPKAHYTLVKVLHYNEYQAAGALFEAAPDPQTAIHTQHIPKEESSALGQLLGTENAQWLAATCAAHHVIGEPRELVAAFCTEHPTAAGHLYELRKQFHRYLYHRKALLAN